MPTPFAALEARVNAAVLAKTANATATIAGQAVDGVFEAEYQEVLGVAAAQPAFVADATALASVQEKSALTVTCPSLGMANVPYTVGELRPEHGMTRLVLRKA